MNIIKPNYEESITNLSNSLLKHFGCETYHNTLSFIDKVLDKNYKNVIVVLCDGMGSILLDEILPKDSFLVKNRIKSITSVYPPTTTAATTSILSGLNPNEHGWLGWDLYFKKENKTISMFKNTLKDTEIKAEDYDVAQNTYPYESILKSIGRSYEVYSILPYLEAKYRDFNNQINDIIELSKKQNKKFIYSYYEEPDHLLHDFGISDEKVKNEFQNINNCLERLCSNIDDSIVIITADHGHIDCEFYNLNDYPSIKKILERTTSIEPRATSFKIVADKKNEFEEEFNMFFKDEFILLNKEQIINSKIFGTGFNNSHFDEAIGDYVAIAKANKGIVFTDKKEYFKSHHAGLTDREMLIPIIVSESPKIKVKR